MYRYLARLQGVLKLSLTSVYRIDTNPPGDEHLQLWECAVLLYFLAHTVFGVQEQPAPETRIFPLHAEPITYYI